MNVTAEIITDLLPVYLSGEASEDTRALVEAYFRDHPEFAALAAKMDNQRTGCQRVPGGDLLRRFDQTPPDASG